jgi:hypothetical protein
MYFSDLFLLFIFTNEIFFIFLEAFEVACEIQQDIVMHPFAFRTHAHKLGKIFVSFFFFSDKI